MTDNERIHWLRHEIFRKMDLNEDVFELKRELLALEVKHGNK